MSQWCLVGLSCLNCSLCRSKPCLFNLQDDPTEHDDVADSNPDLVQELVDFAKEIAEEYHPPQHDPAQDLSGYCGAIKVSACVHILSSNTRAYSDKTLVVSLHAAGKR